MIDSVNDVETPEGVGIDFSLAGPGARALAQLIDIFIRFAVYLIAAIVFSFLGHVGNGLAYLLLFVCEWFYPVFFEVHNKGQTPGKRAVGLAVIQENGSPVGYSGSMLRNLLRAVDFLPFLYMFGLIATLTTRRFQRLGDLVAGTVVVYRSAPVATYQLPEAVPKPPTQPLELEEQRALIAFAERYTTLSEQRAVELANILSPMIGKSDQEAVENLYSQAAWLVGRRK